MKTEVADAIRTEYAAGGVSGKQLAHKYGVGEASVWRAVHGTTDVAVKDALYSSTTPVIAPSDSIETLDLTTAVSEDGTFNLASMADAINMADDFVPQLAMTFGQAQQRFTLRQVDPRQVWIDMHYARRLNVEQVRMIAATFDPALAQVVDLNERPDGRLVNMDGRHRSLGSIKAAWPMLDARIHHGLTPKQEAWTAAELNRRRYRYQASATFKALLFAQNDVAIGITNIIQPLGLVVGDVAANRSSTNGKINAAGKLMEIFRRRDGAELLKRTLTVLAGAWGDDSRAYQASVLEGMSQFIRKWERNPNLDLARLTKALAAASYEVVAGRVHRKLKDDLQNWGAGSAWSKSFQEVHDKDTKKRLVPKVNPADYIVDRRPSRTTVQALMQSGEVAKNLDDLETVVPGNATP
jgi:hypothetical protein